MISSPSATKVVDDNRSVSSIPSEVAEDHNAHIVRPPKFDSKSIKKYLYTRITSLWVGWDELSSYSWKEVLNPFYPLKEMNLHQWNFFFMAYGGWTMDAFDFFLTSLNVGNLAKSFNRSTKDITWGITLVLMFRTVGALIFGFLGDTFGRKWPFIINMSCLIAIQIGTGFVTTYTQFLAVRAVFGIAMGGIFGICAAEALGDAPIKARGVLSGIYQEGYALGYLLAVCFQRAFEETDRVWQNMFFFSAGVSVIFVVWRLFNPETDNFQRQKAIFQKGAKAKKSELAEFKSQAKKAIRVYWLNIIYLVLLMSGFNFSSHGSQDMYPTMLTSQYHFGNDKTTVVNVCANLGAIAGGTVISHLSTFIGRRTAILLGNVFAAAFIYPWAFKPMWVTAFFMQFGIQGSWAVVPIHLSELSPPHFKSFVTGTAYQLGNLVSSASSTIEATINESLDDFGKTMAIFIGAIIAYLMIVNILGPENRGADLEANRDDEFSIFDVEDEEDMEEDDLNKTHEEKSGISANKKPEFEHRENVSDSDLDSLREENIGTPSNFNKPEVE
ncbi:hypothetical protein KGF56_001505 [Candida oxycetoniae]|uniref:Major facilitator superfamily (MFS) profile domain-containing protein n=1 Tax=Candida oxycetoniae TaxID=497107 RepID=A0AAI9SYT0_9ASCO|nr:uncharacterized protein KGF56_001505 [Candida oxycetoniae]KAI3405487.1 hypothetical protein KGF56_001505 [Candida oxycetoniae]